mmetsp:Transcript_3295/g.4848  ORF Transcript_3295/g.4848 Transcript_3295/m.4848 type:complete len:469 (+) Transcript_3295:1-1407(+)
MSASLTLENIPGPIFTRICAHLSNQDLFSLQLTNHSLYTTIKKYENEIFHTKIITCSAPVNIAVIKYWGKRDEDLILPVNSSLSGTLDQSDLRSVTSVMASRRLSEDELYLNGQRQDITYVRLQNCLNAVRQRAQTLDNRFGFVPKDAWQHYHVKIVSVNNFPTAAGLASSASGYCALVYTLSKLFGLHSSLSELSSIARLGSGSACRSMFGGFVAWDMGERDDGLDSKARQIVDQSHWSDMHILVLVVCAGKKDVGSTAGMRNPVKGDLLAYRAKHIVPQRMEEITKAIQQRDLSVFCDLTMKDSDNFHEICAATIPPLYYMNDVSRDIQKVVRAYNAYKGKLTIAYTYDAGPNAVIYLPKSEVELFLAFILKCFPTQSSHDLSDGSSSNTSSSSSSSTSEPFIRSSLFTFDHIANTKVEPDLISALDQQSFGNPQPNALHYIIHTKVGPGPQVLSDSHQVMSSINK